MEALVIAGNAAVIKNNPLEKFLSGKKSAQTKRAYLTDIRLFLSFAGISNTDELLELAPGQIFILASDYRNSLAKYVNVDGTPYNPSKDRNEPLLKNGATIARKVSTLKTFFEYLTNTGLYTKNPIGSLESVKVPTESTSHGMTEREVSEIFKQVNTNTTVGKRDKLVLAFLIHCAMRRSEVAYLRIGNFIRDDSGIMQVNYIAKGGKKRVIDLKPDVVDPLSDYLQATGRTFQDKEQYLFLSHSNRNSGKANSITDQTIWDIVSKYVEKASIKKNITPHSFRHTAVTISLERNGGNYQRVMNLTGHSDIRMVMRYDRGDKSRNNATYDLPSFY